MASKTSQKLTAVSRSVGSLLRPKTIYNDENIVDNDEDWHELSYNIVTTFRKDSVTLHINKTTNDTIGMMGKMNTTGWTKSTLQRMGWTIQKSYFADDDSRLQQRFLNAPTEDGRAQRDAAEHQTQERRHYKLLPDIVWKPCSHFTH
eukprot:5135721-Amphidinium_carterae.1